MKKFKRDNNKNRKNYYLIFILIEISFLSYLCFSEIHWAFAFFISPIILIDSWSNFRCYKRQKKFIQELSISSSGIIITQANHSKIDIQLDECIFSIREVKFEKEKTEIEIRKKRFLKSKLIGRIHINNWKEIFRIKDTLLKSKIPQVKYRPEGYWSKYGTFTADVVITGSAIVLGELADINGDSTNSSDIRDELIMPLTEFQTNKSDEPIKQKAK